METLNHDSTFSQSAQDKFVLKVLNYKTNGYFLEIGSNHPININNSYLLEKLYQWNGLMVEYDRSFEELYKTYRSSNYIIKDAREVDYLGLFREYNFPKNMDYLQIDLEVTNGSTIETLEVLDKTIFPEYTFNVVTFEHDIYVGDHYDTRKRSREIFKKNGYTLFYSNVKNQGCEYEDWYIHSSLNKDFPMGDSMDYSKVIKFMDE
jgi:hypothetical protein